MLSLSRIRTSRLRCLSTVGLVLCASCDDMVGGNNREVAVSITLQRSWDPPPVLHVSIEGRSVDVTGRRDGSRAERELQAPQNGDLPVSVRLLTPTGALLATTQFTQAFARDFAHWVAVDVGPRRPVGHCIGTLVALPLGTTTDTAFVMYGRIPVGAVC